MSWVRVRVRVRIRTLEVSWVRIRVRIRTLEVSWAWRGAGRRGRAGTIITTYIPPEYYRA